ncbi:hypothetical protein L1987_80722 [Smallanthus sonchifolius]|uniref:Uncharacterized protein n=1 Tax=Smallanthus sonchifolius TaxID=185202 RepID=A0ACB8YNG2_9ASTR|nr:hypothetical protein L1987_80722 [Smallanthus sonchifolius]
MFMYSFHLNQYINPFFRISDLKSQFVYFSVFVCYCRGHVGVQPSQEAYGRVNAGPSAYRVRVPSAHARVTSLGKVRKI